MIAVGWYITATIGEAPSGDMIGHAAAARWLRTLPWWDWRGWSDWFYGGQAIGVNYPPAGHALIRFVHPVHGQMAAVAVGLLVLVPWAALRLTRAVGCSPSRQRGAVAAVLVLTAASTNMHWFLSGFHHLATFYGSWPAMIATAVGLHAAAFAARGEKPLACGAVAGLALLFNATVMPGVAVVAAVMLATSGKRPAAALRWALTATAAAVAVSAWWLVPFMAGWARLVRWEVTLANAWDSGGLWQAVVMVVIVVAVSSAVRAGGPARRLGIAAAAGLAATVGADLLGYLRAERWMEPPLLVAAMTVGMMAAAAMPETAARPWRPAWVVVASACLAVFTVVVVRIEFVPVAVWMMRGSRRIAATAAAVAWTAVLMFVPVGASLLDPTPGNANEPVLEAVTRSWDGSEGGLVFADPFFNTRSGNVQGCRWGYPWRITVATDGLIRPLAGLYRETSPVAEFLRAETDLRDEAFTLDTGSRRHWAQAWNDAANPPLHTPAAAAALGARWYAQCTAFGIVAITELPHPETVAGTRIQLQPDETAWHSAAVRWWVQLASGAGNPSEPVPALADGLDLSSYPPGQAATGLSAVSYRDGITIDTQQAGWVWLRTPWDPHWHASEGAVLLKGGPGHMVLWAPAGRTDLRWGVPAAVDAAAAAVTAAAVLAAATLSIADKRRRGPPGPARAAVRAAVAVEIFASTVDGWYRSAARKLRKLAGTTFDRSD